MCVRGVSAQAWELREREKREGMRLAGDREGRRKRGERACGSRERYVVLNVKGKINALSGWFFVRGLWFMYQ